MSPGISYRSAASRIRFASLTLGIAGSFVAPASLAQKQFRCRLGSDEKQATEAIAALRKALPAAPSGWSARDEDPEVDCEGQPPAVNIIYLRSYLHVPGGSSSQEQGDVAELEQRLAALRAEQQETASKLVAARAARDPALLQPLQQKSREVQLEQAKVLREIGSKKAEMGRKAGEKATAEYEAARKPENKASVSVSTNRGVFGRVYPNSKRLSVEGVPLAIQDRGAGGLVVTQLFFGKNAPPDMGGKESVKVPLDAASPVSRIQNLVVRIDGTAEATEQLLKGIDVAGLDALVKR